MTATITEDEVDSIIEEDYDEPTPCVWAELRNCLEAKWVIIVPCCGKRYPYCQACMDNFLELYSNPTHKFGCNRCFFRGREGIIINRL